VTRVTKMGHGKISVARGIHCCPIISFAQPASLYCKEGVCVCMCVCVCVCVHTYIRRVSRGNVPDFGRISLKLKYTDITKNIYIQS